MNMLRIIVGKEILSTLLDIRFAITTVTMLVLIPLGFYVSREDYERRLDEYDRVRQTYQRQYGHRIHSDVKIRGYRCPSVLNVFASGLEPVLPDEVVTDRSGAFTTSKSFVSSSPNPLLLERVDFSFSISLVVSLMALVLTFNAVCGEKETGTLRQTIAYPVARSQIVLGKVCGSYLILLVPLTIALLVSTIILDTSPAVAVVSPPFLSSFALVVLVTLLFVLTMTSLASSSPV